MKYHKSVFAFIYNAVDIYLQTLGMMEGQNVMFQFRKWTQNTDKEVL